MQCIMLLGDCATNTKVKEGHVIACSALQVHEWRNERSLQTSLLSVIEINPTTREGIPEIEDIDESEPRKKAMRLSIQPPIPVAEAKRIGQGLIADARALKTTTPHNAMVRARFKKLDKDFFEHDVPIFGEEGNEKMCWRTVVSDASGELEVKVWDGPCHVLFGVTASGLREQWEAGHDDEAQQDSILKLLNNHMDRFYDCIVSIDVWAPSSRTEFRIQVNLNTLEASDA